MKTKMTMLADELEMGMLVHPPTWVEAPDRVGPIVELDVGARVTTIKVDGAMKFVKRNDEYVTVLKP
jgi:hypothetical protein